MSVAPGADETAADSIQAWGTSYEKPTCEKSGLAIWVGRSGGDHSNREFLRHSYLPFTANEIDSNFSAWHRS